MKIKLIGIISILFCLQMLNAQSKVTITVKTPNKEDEVYIAGNQKSLGNWQPKAIKMNKLSSFKRTIQFIPDSLPIEFKFTRGSWNSEALIKFNSSNLIINKNIKDTAFTISVWSDELKDQRLKILKKAKKYNYSDNRFIPKFEYQSMNNPNLVEIRKELNLDSIAGKGSEISKILNLMHWVHNIVEYQGNNGDNFAQKNALNLIKTCKAENRGANCRMMATILNECYLSMGIKSRYVVCMPKETQFKDCHVINMVYSNDLKKWIWIDPVYDAYVMNEKGEMLGIEEVRERLITDKMLIVNPDINLNRTESVSKEEYLAYMAKNLYRLESPLISEYDTETWERGKKITYVELLPLDGVQTPQKQDVINPTLGVDFIYYKTNNPAVFWKIPE